MALQGTELIIVAVILVVLFLWGPQKLPELARSIGLAKKEFDKAAKEAPSTATATTSPTSQDAADPLIVAAHNLGITTEGKTKNEIAKEIADRTAKN